MTAEGPPLFTPTTESTMASTQEFLVPTSNATIPQYPTNPTSETTTTHEPIVPTSESTTTTVPTEIPLLSLLQRPPLLMTLLQRPPPEVMVQSNTLMEEPLREASEDLNRPGLLLYLNSFIYTNHICINSISATICSLVRADMIPTSF